MLSSNIKIQEGRAFNRSTGKTEADRSLSYIEEACLKKKKVKDNFLVNKVVKGNRVAYL